MDETESQAVRGAEQTPEPTRAETEAADRAARSLRTQIAALRDQVREAQETLRKGHPKGADGQPKNPA